MRTASGYQPPAVPYHTPIRGSLSTPRTIPFQGNAQYITNRLVPHIHLDRADDPDRRRFKFEISLVDMLATGEPVLVLQKDVKKHINRTNKTECSWNGYAKLRKGAIEYLESGPEDDAPRGSRSNLESFIMFWNKECGTDPNRLAKYIKDHNVDVLDKYRVYFPFLYPPVSTKKQ